MKFKRLYSLLALSLLVVSGCATTTGNSSSSSEASSISSSEESSSLVPSSSITPEPISASIISSSETTSPSTSEPSSSSSSESLSSSSSESLSSSSSETSSSESLSSSSSESSSSSSSSLSSIPSGTINVTKALEIAKSLGEGKTSDTSYTIQGFVSNNFEPKESTQTAGQYNFDVVDSQGGEFLISWWLSGPRLPIKGEPVTLNCKLQHYVDAKKTHKYECVNGTFTVSGSTSSSAEPISSSSGPISSSSSESSSSSSSSSSSTSISIPGEEVTISYRFTSKKWEASPENWISIIDGYDYASGAVQSTSSKPNTSCKSPRSYNFVSKVDITYWCNSNNKSKGDISVSVNDTKLTKEIDASYTSSKKGHLVFEFASKPAGEVTLLINPTVKSIYVSDVSITFSDKAPEPIYPTSISVPSTMEIGVGKSKELEVTFYPKECNQRNVTLTSSNSEIVSVNGGKINALKIGNATVTAQALNAAGEKLTASCMVTVTEAQKDDYTILVYMCGSTLEYDSSYDEGDYFATADIDDMLSNSCPSGVNVVIETGGATKWSSKYGIKNDKIGRYHIEGKSLLNDAQLPQADMSKESTLESFVRYGISTYPAEKMSLILWDHGGGAQGVCYDDNYNEGYEALTAGEVGEAMKNAFNANNFKDKFEWIGYDACIMSYLDSASINADYFNYMIASQELENGDGWDYKTSFKRIYDNPGADSKTLLSLIAKDFVDYYSSGEIYEEYEYNDQTMALLDLSKMPTLITAFENYVATFKDENDAFEGICMAMDECELLFGYSFYEDYEGVYLFYDTGLVDFYEFLINLKILYDSSLISDVITALEDLVINSYYGDYYDELDYKPCGIDIFLSYGFYFEGDIDYEGYFTPSEQVDWYIVTFRTEYTENDTKFLNWRELLLKSDSWGDDYHGY